MLDQRVVCDDAFIFEVAHGEGQCDIAASDRRGACAAIGLQDITVDCDLVFAEQFQINNGAQGAANQALDFLCPARLFACCRFAAIAGMRGARQHAVFACDPAFAGIAHPAGHLVCPACRAKHMRVAKFGQTRPFSIAGDIGFKRDVAQLVEGASGRADSAGHCRDPFCCRSYTCLCCKVDWQGALETAA